MNADAQRVADEVARCNLLAPRYRTWSDGDGLGSDHAYYLARAHILRAAATADAVRFLREEALRALTGENVGGIMAAQVARWQYLRHLEYLTACRTREANRPLRQTMDIDRARLAAIGAPPGWSHGGR